ncbi:rhodanese-like domain-containing protein [Algoriphagus hitonicola]|uniref:Rhodanese-related sulfurtransferase n=1 Tax=Algoriphagus hitonicola TaxID=435880 RepID=A0A1I2NDP4_9BACT|nr:rhodanese-like domain-containing protein [Algoriphagus hitonicola]SFG00979.1 Rhodanese-related sulfurtransferase [Algoriphagus hitonicola]
MKKLIFLPAILFMLTLIGNPLLGQGKSDSAKVVSVEKFDKMISKKKNVLLDIRTPEEIADGQIKGALNIDFLDENFAQNIEQLDKSKTYLLYCRTGKRTAKAGAAMKAAGFKKVYMLDGGLTAWKEQQKPTTND